MAVRYVIVCCFLSSFLNVIQGQLQSVDCDFENATSYTCAWTRVTTLDGFSWTRHSGPTSSTGTGPNADHTKSTSSGHYLYIETSSPRRRGDKARIVSALIGVNPPFPVCFSLWYNMYGSQIGSLGIYKSETTASTPTSRIGLWSLSGNQGSSWKRMELTVNNTNPVKLIIEGIVGSGYEGDIAIDDLHLQAGACGGASSGLTSTQTSPTPAPASFTPSSTKTTTTTTTTTTATTMTTASSTRNPFDCDFDHSLCGWRQDIHDNFDWTRNRGSTSSSNTGPGRDHTTGSGYYMYIEASSPRQQGDRANLISPTLHPRNSQYECLTFWYHMYGSSSGELKVIAEHQVYDSSLYRNTTVWHRNGNHGNVWLQANATLSPPGPITIMFEAVRGIDHYSDIAIDDVRVLPYHCMSRAGIPPVG